MSRYVAKKIANAWAKHACRHAVRNGDYWSVLFFYPINIKFNIHDNELFKYIYVDFIAKAISAAFVITLFYLFKSPAIAFLTALLSMLFVNNFCVYIYLNMFCSVVWEVNGDIFLFFKRVILWVSIALAVPSFLIFILFSYVLIVNTDRISFFYALPWGVSLGLLVVLLVLVMRIRR